MLSSTASTSNASIYVLLAASFAAGSLAAQPLATTPGKVQPPPSYVGQGIVPPPVRDYLLAFGDRIQKPGNERTMLIGACTDSSGTKPAQLVWEVPGKLRFDRGAVGSNPLIFDPATGLANAAAVPQSDLDLLESLLDDGIETFLYSFVRGYAHRFLGARFRTDNGQTPNYTGPLYDIYEMIAPVQVAPAVGQRQKHFYFDSISKFPVKTQYVLHRSGSSTTVSIETDFNTWAIKNGQAFVGQIVRKENGNVVFTFNVASATAGPSAADGLFPQH